MANQQLLRLEEVARRLSISYTKARILVLYDESIPYVKVGARGIRIREEDLEKYIANLEYKQEAPSEVVDTREAYEGRKILSSEEEE